MSIYKPAPPHNPLMAPAVCLCVDCSRIVLDLRCRATDAAGNQCGDYKHHHGQHTRLICTIFDIANERATTVKDGQFR